MANISKKNLTEFYNTIKNIIKDTNAIHIESTESKEQYKLDTSVGELYITIYLNYATQIYTIYNQFEDPELAYTRFDCNKHNGKYNFHYSDKNQCTESFESFLQQLQQP